MQTPRDVSLHAPPVLESLAQAASKFQCFLNGRNDTNISVGVQLCPFLSETTLSCHALDLLGVDLVVDEVSLVARFGVGDIGAKDDIVKGFRG